MKAKTVLSSIFAGLALGVQAQAKTINADDRILVAYFSHSGNTREIAQQISQASGGALFEIVPANAYPEDYQDLTAVTKKEIQDGIKPELQANVEDIGKYDVIFIGSPCWWGTIAAPVSSFLAANNLSGKKVIPFMTHGGSGLGYSESDIKKLVPDAELVSGKAFWGSLVKNAQDDVNNWLKELQND